jgi:organic hydroperoxide reductase OsmC/OhrA
MAKEHRYAVTVAWIGNQGTGTSGYKTYARDHEIRIDGKPPIPASSDPGFRGDPARYNPEDLLVASLSGCHMLWYLHLCSTAGIVVTQYIDRAEGTMVESPTAAAASQASSSSRRSR